MGQFLVTCGSKDSIADTYRMQYLDYETLGDLFTDIRDEITQKISLNSYGTTISESKPVDVQSFKNLKGLFESSF